MKFEDHFTGVNPARPVAPVDGTGVNKKSLAEKTIEDVLLRFGNKRDEARRSYRQFVKNGVDQGSRPELQGGGLVRSAGGDKIDLLGRKKEEREKGDERILGSGDFVLKVLQEPEKEYGKRNLQSPSLQEISTIVTDYFGLHFPRLISRDRSRTVSKARAAISYLAVDKVGYTQAEVGDHLNISRIGVRNSMLRADKMLDICREIWQKID